MLPAPEKITSFMIRAADEGQRLDNYLIKLLKGWPRPAIYRLIRSGQVRVNKKRAAVSYKLLSDDQLRLPPLPDILALLRGKTQEQQAPALSSSMARLLEQSVIYEEAGFFVINKPATLASHGGSGLQYGVIEALRLLRQDPDLALVHRLDQGTSGCLIISKKRSALRHIQAQFREGLCTKKYWAILRGEWAGPKKGAQSQEVRLSLEKYVDGRGERRVRISAHPEAQAAHTSFRPLLPLSGATVVECTLHTGRTHQIRVHSAALGHPVLGDEKYAVCMSVEEKKLHRLCLHARFLSFHNRAGESIVCVAPVPAMLYEQGLLYAKTAEQKEAWHALCHENTRDVVYNEAERAPQGDSDHTLLNHTKHRDKNDG